MRSKIAGGKWTIETLIAWLEEQLPSWPDQTGVFTQGHVGGMQGEYKEHFHFQHFTAIGHSEEAAVMALRLLIKMYRTEVAPGITKEEHPFRILWRMRPYINTFKLFGTNKVNVEARCRLVIVDTDTFKEALSNIYMEACYDAGSKESQET